MGADEDEAAVVPFSAAALLVAARRRHDRAGSPTGRRRQRLVQAGGAVDRELRRPVADPLRPDDDGVLDEPGRCRPARDVVGRRRDVDRTGRVRGRRGQPGRRRRLLQRRAPRPSRGASTATSATARTPGCDPKQLWAPSVGLVGVRWMGYHAVQVAKDGEYTPYGRFCIYATTSVSPIGPFRVRRRQPGRVPQQHLGPGRRHRPRRVHRSRHRAGLPDVEDRGELLRQPPVHLGGPARLDRHQARRRRPRS